MVRRSAKRGFGPRGTSFTEIKAKDFANIIKRDLNEEIDASLNGFVKAVVNDLSNVGTRTKAGGISPVLTGFLLQVGKQVILMFLCKMILLIFQDGIKFKNKQRKAQEINLSQVLDHY